MAFRYILRRLLPFLCTFLAIETLLRLALLMAAWHQIGLRPLAILRGLLVGVAFDLAVSPFFLLPVGILLLAMPQRSQTAKADRLISSGLFFLLVFGWLFGCVAEWLFWDEFSARFNFIAVDYLIYTREVVGNIRESYPVAPMVSAVAVIALAAAWMHARYLRGLTLPVPRLGRRLQALMALIVLCFVSYFGMKSDYSELDENRYLNEVTKNGLYELFSAYFNNSLKYDRFYVTGREEILLARLRHEFSPNGNPPFIDDKLTRRIDPPGEEHHYNVVLITVESLSASYMARFGSKDHVTPHLDALAENSVFFSNLYANGTRTVYGLSAVTLSMPPIPGNSIVRRPQNGGLFSLGEVFNRKGYRSTFIYGGYGYFDNMNAFFAGNGYGIVDRAMLAKDEVSFANVWGVCDEDLFNRTLKENDRTYKEGKPFFDMVMTTSNHRPFTFPDGRIDLKSKSGRLGGVKYTDYAIDKFLKDAKTKPWFANTIFVIVADHTAGAAGKTEIDPHGYHIPLFIYAPGIVKPQIVDKLASQIDLAPTLLGLMNMHYDTRFYGADLMKTSPDRAFVSNYQELGLMTPNDLVVIKPVRQVDHFVRQGEDWVASPSPVPPSLMERTLSYYQLATHWKEWSRDIGNPAPAVP